jgi:hypothetical protein
MTSCVDFISVEKSGQGVFLAGEEPEGAEEDITRYARIEKSPSSVTPKTILEAIVIRHEGHKLNDSSSSCMIHQEEDEILRRLSGPRTGGG